MEKPGAYAHVRVNDDSYNLIRGDQPRPAPVASIVTVRDRLGTSLGWKLKPVLVMQGSKSRIWATAAEAIASTKLMAHGEAKAAVKQADSAKSAKVGEMP